MAEARPILAENPSCALLRSMAKVHMAFGDYSKAQPLLEQALGLAETKKADDAELALCLIDAAWLYKNLYKLDKAEEMCLAGLQLQEQVHGKDHPYVTYTLRILSSIYQEQGRFVQAVSVLDRATAIAEKHSLPGSASLAALEVDFGTLMKAMGDFAKAEAYYSRALPVVIENCGPDHLYTAQVLGKIAGLYAAQGKYAQAEALITRTLTIQEKVYGPHNRLMVPAWLTMARIHVSQARYPQAQELCQKALSLLESVCDEDYPRIAEARKIMDQALRKSARTTTTPVVGGTESD
ncbi:MAG: tetratricopeptide repeat protein [Sedimentisphaerales bacterium]|nr:tetratricopeptide repeat protein [Sedimentisphaerales bacterium]